MEISIFVEKMYFLSGYFTLWGNYSTSNQQNILGNMSNNYIRHTQTRIFWMTNFFAYYFHIWRWTKLCWGDNMMGRRGRNMFILWWQVEVLANELHISTQFSALSFLSKYAKDLNNHFLRNANSEHVLIYYLG